MNTFEADATEEFYAEQDRLTSRWEGAVQTLLKSLREAAEDDSNILSIECDGHELAFAVRFNNGMEVSFDWGDGDGSEFHVVFADDHEELVVVDDGGPSGFGASIDWIERVANDPVGISRSVIAHAKRRRQRSCQMKLQIDRISD